MKGDFEFLVLHAVETARSLPVGDRIRVYRGAAVALGQDESTSPLLKLAAELEAVDQRCFAFARQLRQQPLFTEPTQGGAR